MKSRPFVLSIRSLEAAGAFANQSEGNAFITRFCHSIEDGETPPMEDLKAVAHALKVLSFGSATDAKLRELADRLGVKRKQGKQQSASANWYMQTMTVVDYLATRDEYIEAGENLNDAQAAARSLVASKNGIKDRAMRNRIEQYGERAESIYAILRDMNGE